MKPLSFLLPALFLWLGPATLQAQDTVYYQSPRIRVEQLQMCDYYSIVTPQATANLYQEVQYLANHHKFEEQYYTILGHEKTKVGTWKTWYENGQLKSIKTYQNDQLDGPLETFWSNGQLKRKEVFAQGEAQAGGKCYNSKGKEIAYFSYYTKAQFPGGEKAMTDYLLRHIYYPQNPQKLGGRVVVRFEVNEQGEVVAPKIINNAEKNQAAMVLKAVKKMPKWRPAKLDGEPISEYVSFPVDFIRN